jgi:hypothetical protein
MRKLIAILLAASALTGVALDAEAKGPKPARRGGGLYLGPGIPHGHSAPANVLSRAELQWCVNGEASIDAADAAIATAKADLEGSEQGLNRYSQSAINRHNAMVDAFNEKVRANNAVIDDWNSRCANRSYYVRDMDAIRGGQ